MPLLLSSLLTFVFHLSLTKENTRTHTGVYARDFEIQNFLTFFFMAL